MAKTTEFGRLIKIRLIEKDQTQAWLIREIQKKTGLYIDHGYLWKIMCGHLATPAVVAAIKEILGLEDQKNENA